MAKHTINPRARTRHRIRAGGWTILALLATAALADRAGLFGYRGDDRAVFDHQQARVIEVLDGDTVRVETAHHGRGTTVRLLGVDAPDLPSWHWSEQSKRYTSNRLRDRTVTLRLDPVQTRTADGNLLAYVYITDGDCLNVDIVRDGQAYADRRTRCSLHSPLAVAETEARKKLRGLWKDVTEQQMPRWRREWLRRFTSK